jgi:hypothetical protein
MVAQASFDNQDAVAVKKLCMVNSKRAVQVMRGFGKSLVGCLSVILCNGTCPLHELGAKVADRVSAERKYEPRHGLRLLHPIRAEGRSPYIV